MGESWLRCTVDYKYANILSEVIEDHILSLNISEDPTSLPSMESDADGFPIASKFLIEASVSNKDVKKVKALLESMITLLNLQNTLVTIAPIIHQDWLQSCYDAQATQEIDQFFIKSSYNNSAIPIGKIPLIIDAATAFGSGEHSTTRGCLKAIIQISRKLRINSA